MDESAAQALTQWVGLGSGVVAQPLHELPAGYTEYHRYVLTDQRLLLMLNLAALIPLALSLILMALWQAIVVGGLRSAGIVHPLPSGGDIPWWLGVIIGFFVVLPFHELLHGIMIRRFGHRVKYGIKWEMGALYALAENALFRRNQYLIVLLTPITVITLLGLLLNLWLPDSWSYVVVLGVALNAGGAIGDLWMARILLRFPPHVIIRDDATGFTLFDLAASEG